MLISSAYCLNWARWVGNGVQAGDRLFYQITYLILCNLKTIEAKKLYCDLGYSSLHGYLERELGYSSAEAALRVANVKLMKIAPIVEQKMAEGALNLTQGGSLFLALSKSGEENNNENKNEKLIEAIEMISGKSTRETDKIISEIFQVKNKLRETIILSERLKEKLERLKKIYGEKSFEELVEIVVDEKLWDTKIKPEKQAGSDGIKNVDSPNSRFIPISVKREVVVRAQKQCEFVGENLHRCGERRNLEFEHVVPYSFGGAHSVLNLKLFCRGHNQRAAIAANICHLRRKKSPMA